VFLSSHLLGEIEQVCDRVAILARGRCITTGSVDDVLRRGRTAGLLVRLAPQETQAALAALNEAGIEASPSGTSIRVRLDPADGARVTRTLADRGLYVAELRPDEATLEDVFLELTGEPAASTSPAPSTPPEGAP
jgi:ABC-2 type transport system ATP-binding protein